MQPELKVIAFHRENGKPTQQQHHVIPVPTEEASPPQERDLYQGFADDENTSRTTRVPLKFLQRASSGAAAARRQRPSAPQQQQQQQGDELQPQEHGQQEQVAGGLVHQPRHYLQQQQSHDGQQSQHMHQHLPQQTQQQQLQHLAAIYGGDPAFNDGGHDTEAARSRPTHLRYSLADAVAREAQAKDGVQQGDWACGVPSGVMGRSASATMNRPVGALNSNLAAGGAHPAVLPTAPGVPSMGSRPPAAAAASLIPPGLPQAQQSSNLDDARDAPLPGDDAFQGLQQPHGPTQLEACLGGGPTAPLDQAAPQSGHERLQAPRQGSTSIPARSQVEPHNFAGAVQQPVSLRVRIAGPFGLPVSATGQNRREIFHRQAWLASQMQRMGMPPMMEWGSSSLMVGKVVQRGEGTQPSQLSAFSLKQQQQQQGRQQPKMKQTRPMSSQLQQQQQGGRDRQQEGLAGKQLQPQQPAAHGQAKQQELEPVHAWRLDWEARKRRAALNGPAAQHARRLKAQKAREHAQPDELSDLAAEYEARYRDMNRLEEKTQAAVDGFSHTLVQSMRPLDPNLAHHKVLVPSNETQGGNKGGLRSRGVDMVAWQQAHDRLDAYNREQAQRQKQCASEKKRGQCNEHLERLALLLATVQKDGGTLGIEVPNAQRSQPSKPKFAPSKHAPLEAKGTSSRDVASPPHQQECQTPDSSQVSPPSSSCPSSPCPAAPAHQHARMGLPTQTALQPQQADGLAAQQQLRSQELTLQHAQHRTPRQREPRPSSAPQRYVAQFDAQGQQHSSETSARHQVQPHAAKQHKSDILAAQQSMPAAPDLPQHGPATSHRYDYYAGRKPDQNKKLQVVYYSVKRKSKLQATRKQVNSGGQKQQTLDQPLQHTQQTLNHPQQHTQQAYKQGKPSWQNQQSWRQQQLQQQQLGGDPSSQGKLQQEQLHQYPQQQQLYPQQQQLYPQQQQQQYPQQQYPQQQHPQQQQQQQQEQDQALPSFAPVGLSAVPNLCASDGCHLSPQAEQISRFADASDAGSLSNSHDDWGVSSEDADEKGFPRLAGGSSAIPETPGLHSSDGPCNQRQTASEEGLDSESSDGSWGIQQPSPLLPHAPKFNSAAVMSQVEAPKLHHSLQNLLDERGLADVNYEPPRDTDVPPIKFSPVPPWLVRPLEDSPPRYRITPAGTRALASKNGGQPWSKDHGHVEEA